MKNTVIRRRRGRSSRRLCQECARCSCGRQNNSTYCNRRRNLHVWAPADERLALAKSTDTTIFQSSLPVLSFCPKGSGASPVSIATVDSGRASSGRPQCQSQIFHAWTSTRSWTYVTKLIKDCVSIASSCKSSWRGLPCLAANGLLVVVVGEVQAR